MLKQRTATDLVKDDLSDSINLRPQNGGFQGLVGLLMFFPCVYRPPEPETLREARTKRLKEIKMNAIMKEIAAFFIFLIMLMNVAYYHRDPNTFLMTKTLHETFDEVDAWSIDLGAVRSLILCRS